MVGSFPLLRALWLVCASKVYSGLGADLLWNVGVEKVRDRIFFPPVMIAVAEFLFSPQLRGGFHSGYCRLTEEAHQSLDVLSYRCQEELLAHEPESPQTQAPQSDLILQFCKQGLYLLSLPLCMGELWGIDQLPRTLSGWFVLVDDKAPEGSMGALWS